MSIRNRGSHFHQYYAAVVANVLRVVYGLLTGWTSPAIPILQSENTPLKHGPATTEEISWISSNNALGAMLATLVFGTISDFVGRKKTIYMAAFLQFAAWVLIKIGDHVYYLYMARFLGGMGGGAIMVVLPVFVAEIADNRIRGRLLALFPTAFNVGIITIFTMGKFVNYKVIPVISTLIICIFVIGFIPIHDPPKYLLSKNNFESAEKALKYYNGNQQEQDSEIFMTEMEKLQDNSSKIQRNEENTIALKDFMNKQALKASLIAIVMSGIASLTGVFVLLNYTESTFVEAGSTLSPSTSSIIVAIVQLFGSLLSVGLIDRYGRKILVLVSCILTGVFYCLLGTYSYFESSLVEYNLKWIPIVSLSLLIFTSSFGILSVPFVVIPEILPQKIKGIMMSVVMFELWLINFILLKIYPFMLQILGVYGSMWIFGAICLSFSVFVIFGLPETKGKSAEEIKEMLLK